MAGVGTTIDTLRLPLTVRGFLGVTSALKSIGIPRQHIDFDRVKAKAERLTGLQEYNDQKFLDDLETLVGFVNGYSRTSAISALTFRGDLLRRMTNNLRLQAAKRRHPELTARLLERPFLIIGLPRTGTTLLQRMMSHDPDSHGPALWELQHPIRIDQPELEAPARRATNAYVKRVQGISKDLWEIHPAGVDEADECYFLLPQCCGDLTIFAGMDYFNWFLSRSAIPDYKLYRQYLQAMQYEQPPRRLVLKSPLHMPKLDNMLSVFPDTCVIQCHRALSEVIASWISFAVVVRMHAHREVDIYQTAQQWLKAWEIGVKVAQKARDNSVPGQFFDVDYPEFVADPLAMIERIYAHFNVPMTDAARQKMSTWYAGNRQEHKANHRYSLEQFGLTPADLERAFGDYLKRYNVPL